MRTFMIAAATLTLLAATPATAAPKGCPANASAASFSLWPKGAIRTGKTVSGRHACGRRISCTGGSRKGQRRSCSWS